MKSIELSFDSHLQTGASKLEKIKLEKIDNNNWVKKNNGYKTKTKTIFNLS